MGRYINMTEAFTKEGLKKVKEGQALTFLKDGVKTSYRVMRKTDTEVFGKKVDLLTEKEFNKKFKEEFGKKPKFRYNKKG